MQQAVRVLTSAVSFVASILNISLPQSKAPAATRKVWKLHAGDIERLKLVDEPIVPLKPGQHLSNERAAPPRSSPAEPLLQARRALR